MKDTDVKCDVNLQQGEIRIVIETVREATEREEEIDWKNAACHKPHDIVNDIDL